MLSWSLGGEMKRGITNLNNMSKIMLILTGAKAHGPHLLPVFLLFQ